MDDVACVDGTTMHEMEPSRLSVENETEKRIFRNTTQCHSLFHDNQHCRRLVICFFYFFQTFSDDTHIRCDENDEQHISRYLTLTLYSPLTSLDVNGTGSLNVLSASTESLVFLWETDSSSLPFLLRDLANANGLSLHVPISNMFAAAFRSVCEPLGSVFITSCTVPTAEPGIRPPSVSLHVSTHFAKAEVTSF